MAKLDFDLELAAHYWELENGGTHYGSLVRNTSEEWDAAKWVGPPAKPSVQALEAAYVSATEQTAIDAPFTYGGVSIGMSDARIGLYSAIRAEAEADTRTRTIIKSAAGGAPLVLTTKQQIIDWGTAVSAEIGRRLAPYFGE